MRKRYDEEKEVEGEERERDGRGREGWGGKKAVREGGSAYNGF